MTPLLCGFDLNYYSNAPHTHGGIACSTVLADPNVVRIVDGAQMRACHRRRYDKGAADRVRRHVQPVSHNAPHRLHRGRDHLAQRTESPTFSCVPPSAVKTWNRHRRPAASAGSLRRRRLDAAIPRGDRARRCLTQCGVGSHSITAASVPRPARRRVAVILPEACQGARCSRAATSARTLMTNSGAKSMSTRSAGRWSRQSAQPAWPVGALGEAARPAACDADRLGEGSSVYAPKLERRLRAAHI